MSEWVQIISTVGFPIAACVGLFWYMNSVMKENNKNTEEAIKKMTEVVNENTKMITVFSTQLEVLLKAIAIKYSDDEEIGREVKEYEIRRSQSKINGSV